MVFNGHIFVDSNLLSTGHPIPTTIVNEMVIEGTFYLFFNYAPKVWILQLFQFHKSERDYGFNGLVPKNSDNGH